jgi:hypothetical protein
MAVALLSTASQIHAVSFLHGSTLANEKVEGSSSCSPPRDVEIEFSGIVNPIIVYSCSNVVIAVIGNTMSIKTVPDRVVTAEDGMTPLRDIVSRISGGILLPSMSADFEDLLSKATAARGLPVDTASWIATLAGDVSTLVD